MSFNFHVIIYNGTYYSRMISKTGKTLSPWACIGKEVYEMYKSRGWVAKLELTPSLASLIRYGMYIR